MWKSFHELVFLSRYEIASLNEANVVIDVTLGFERPQFVTLEIHIDKFIFSCVR